MIQPLTIMLTETFPSASTPLVLICAILMLTVLWWKMTRNSTPANIPPQIGYRLPVVGHYHLIKKNPREQMLQWSKKYNGIFSFYMGSHLVVIIGRVDLMKEAFIKKVDIFGPRPTKDPWLRNAMNRNFGILFANGDTWKEQRALTLKILKEMGMGGEGMANRISEELVHFTQALTAQEGRGFDPTVLTTQAVANVMCKVIVGHRFSYSSKFLQNFAKVMLILTAHLGFLSPVRFFPYFHLIPFDVFGFRTFFRESKMAFESFTPNYVEPALRKMKQRMKEEEEEEKEKGKGDRYYGGDGGGGACVSSGENGRANVVVGKGGPRDVGSRDGYDSVDDGGDENVSRNDAEGHSEVVADRSGGGGSGDDYGNVVGGFQGVCSYDNDYDFPTNGDCKNELKKKEGWIEKEEESREIRKEPKYEQIKSRTEKNINVTEGSFASTKENMDGTRDNKAKKEEKTDDNEERDMNNFIQAYVEEMERKSREGKKTTVNEQNLRGTITDLFQAGTDTTSSSIIWGFVHLMNNPHVQERAFSEILAHVGLDRTPTLHDRPQLHYINAIVHETHRRACIGVFLVPHECTRDSFLGDYFIPKDTYILGLPQALHLESVSEDPLRFEPGRFITEDGHFTTRDMFPMFSIGRRRCPGEAIANDEMFLFFATVIQKFRLLPVDGKPHPLTEVPGLTSKPCDFRVRFVPRD